MTVTSNGITSMAHQKHPDSILWCTRADGTLLSMTYSPDDNVIAWARHPFQVGFGENGSLTGGTISHEYPTLQDLTDAEIPAVPGDPQLTAATTEVSDAAGLQAMSGAGKYYLSADIDLDGVTWTPIANFSGVLDGRGHTIRNLLINTSGYTQGIFATLLGSAQVYDLTFVDCSVTATSRAGILAGMFSGSNHIVKNVAFIDCTVVITYSAYGGLLLGRHTNSDGDQFFDITATNCTVQGTRAGGWLKNKQSKIGMLFGEIRMDPWGTASTSIVRCSVVGGTVSVKTYVSHVGGFAGAAYGREDDDDWFDSDVWLLFHTCTSSATVTCADTDVTSIEMIGGFAGGVDLVIKFVNCSATGTVNLPCYMGWAVGGFIGDESCQATNINSYSTGTVTVGAANTASVYGVGGFIGRVGITPRQRELHCWSTSPVNIIGRVGVGTYTNITGIGAYVGEFEYHEAHVVGDFDDSNRQALIERCWATGDVTITADASSDPSDMDPGIGAFAGSVWVEGAYYWYSFNIYRYTNFQTILRNCYAWGSVSFDTGALNYEIGGLVGSIRAYAQCPVILTNCYAAQTDTAAGSGYTNQLPNAGRCGGLVGYEARAGSTTSTATFWDTETSGQNDSLYGVGHVTDWLQTKSNYEDAGWNFDTIWQLAEVDTRYDYTNAGLGPNSVAVIPSEHEDQIWLVVSRYINGQTVRTLEQMQPRAVTDLEDQWFVDSGLGYDGDPGTVFAGLDHLEGEEVCILADGAVFPRQTVTNGTITLPEPASRVIVGLPFRYVLQPMRFDLQIDGGTTGTIKRFAELVIDLYKSLNVQYGEDLNSLFTIDFRTTEPHGSPPALFTGSKVVTCEGGFNAQDPLVITSDDPTPCTIRALVPRIEVHGR